MSGDLSKYAGRRDSSNLFGFRRAGGWKYFYPLKKAAHGDMSRLGGERHLDVLRSTPQGSKTLLCHLVACQVFFTFFLKKIAQAKKKYQDA
jgi:hypothetical protein